jgi:pimeloyl-ACP methyl ester carboxylesterase
MRRLSWAVAASLALVARVASPLVASGFTSWTRLAASPLMQLPKHEAWKRNVPGLEWIEIPSTADGAMQPALFYDSGSPGPKPLLVALHSWSEDFEQHYGIPYGVWAQENDWVFIHPNFRGEFNRPEATGSTLALQDVLDALAYAKARADVDPRRIYLVGFSGGGMMSLLLAGQHPELWTAVVAWVPVFDLEAWYGEVRRRHPRYAKEIRASCGGAPVGDSAAAHECRRRSPAAYLHQARGRHPRVYIATGIDDPFVSPSHSLRAFNALARPEDRLGADEIAAIAEERRVPAAAAPGADPLYERAHTPVLFARESDGVSVRVFKGRHDVIYNAGLLWLSRQARQS